MPGGSGDIAIGTTIITVNIGIGYTDMITIRAGTTSTIVNAIVAMTIGTKGAASGPAKPSGLKNRTVRKLKPFGDCDGRENFFGNTSLPFFIFSSFSLVFLLV